jgi:hypothetical protein
METLNPGLENWKIVTLEIVLPTNGMVLEQLLVQRVWSGVTSTASTGLGGMVLHVDICVQDNEGR